MWKARGEYLTGSFCAGAVIAEVWIVSRVDQILKGLVKDTVICNVHWILATKQIISKLVAVKGKKR